MIWCDAQRDGNVKGQKESKKLETKSTDRCTRDSQNLVDEKKFRKRRNMRPFAREQAPEGITLCAKA